MYILSMIILIFFAIIGLCAFITAVIDSMHSGAGELLIILRELSEDNAEARIRKAVGICRSCKGTRVICVCEKSDPAYKICEMMQRDHPFITICGKDELKDVL